MMKKHRAQRGSTTNPHNRFFQHEYEVLDDYLEHCALEGEEFEDTRTRYIEVFPKTIVTKNNSPDVPFTWSINPYQGCEHGCVYCYARNSHEYWGYSAGKDFERTILYKPKAPKMLEKWFERRGYQPELVALSGNTDCYQPAERKFKITRQLLQTFLKYKNPVGLITKNALILRDLDILKELNALNLLRLTLSITTLDEDLRRAMEPRTSTIKQRLKALEILTKAGISVNVNMAPIIPGLNNHEVFNLVKEVGQRGAYSVNYILVRLNGQISDIFEDWVWEAFPDRANKVLNQIRETHSGTLNASDFGDRMRGEGRIAEQVKAMVSLARKQYLHAPPPSALDLSQFEIPSDQMRLF
ncbi:PA0069 family radical SAM protein [Sanyastnella coralliicola]|uniref:PA0069 family radical SAM protein n=1 Tax=Sanyastnella coralliicola TaxID=3069118 RepID=UPI0027BAB707|nr:PA0069 family radical SAM protein [Longitalea sp. SCSIO 12813]